MSTALVRAGTGVARAVAVVAGAALTGLLVGSAVHGLHGNRMAPWIVGRATGVAAYLLLVGLVLLGLFLSHPWRTRVSRPSTPTRIRMHLALALFTFGFVAVHLVVLATDRYAGVGWWGSVVPMGSHYRPAATSFGVLAMWSGLLIGGSAALAGRLPRRAWWPVHKVAAGTLVLVWAHGMFAGSDAFALRWMYVASGAAVVVVALSRYLARTPADDVRAVR